MGNSSFAPFTGGQTGMVLVPCHCATAKRIVEVWFLAKWTRP